MIRDMLETLSMRMAASSERVALAVMSCLLESCRRPDRSCVDEPSEQTSLFKAIRQEGLVCMDLLFAKCPQKNWMDKVQRSLFRSVINPRLPTLPIETAQAPSVMLRLFSTWSSSSETVDLLWTTGPSILAAVADCLNVPSAKDDVRIFILKDIVGNLISRFNEDLSLIHI